MKQKYHPINCHFYDELELLALRQKVCTIHFMDEMESQQIISDILVDFQIINNAEYVILKSGKRIRLDYLISVDDKTLAEYGHCTQPT